MRKPGIPSAPTKDAHLASMLNALKENVELLTGVRGGKVNTLASNATLSDVIAKVNEILGRMNAGD